MSTQQKAIRDAIVARLTTELAGLVAPEHIFRSPERDLADNEIPAICIFSHQDRPVDEEDDQRFPHQRVYTLRVEVVAKGRPQEDAADDLASHVRKAVLAEDTLGGLCVRITWVGQLWSGFEGEIVQALSGLDLNCYYLFRPE